MTTTRADLARFAGNMARACALAWRAAPALNAANAALLLVQSVLPLLALYLVKLIVDAIAAALGGSVPAAGLESLVGLIAVATAVALAAAMVGSLANLAGEAQAMRVTDRMHEVLHEKSVQIDLQYYESPQYHDTLHRAQQEAPYRPARIVKGLLATGQNGLSLALMAGLLLSLHWGVALVVFVAVLPEVLVHLKYANEHFLWRRGTTESERRARYYDWMLTGSEHAQELRLFDLGGVFMRRFRDLRARLRRERLHMLARRSAVELGASAAATLAVFGAYVYIAHRALQGGITLGDVVMYFTAFQRGQDFLRQTLRAVAGLYEDNLFLTNLYEFLDLDRRVAEPAQPRAVPRPLRRGIAFEGVCFSYGDRPALHGVDLMIPPGATLALVGENGSGKTTLVKLLARLYDPSAGRITLDGIDLREFSTMALRREIGVIFQDYVRYNLSARENIWFGDASDDPDPSRIAAAAEHAGAAPLIHRLPQGLDTVLGTWFGRGADLSVGEWQKIALARALLRDAQIVVLDEPTSAMDARAEHELFRRFKDLAAGRTAIIVSHRLSTVRMADIVCVLRAGRVAECGTHDALMAHGGDYAGLFEAQASGYR
jgi:ATP-binding cassette subfamily B protein